MNRFFTLAMLADDEMPTIGELIDELFSLNLGDYDNLGISASTLTGLRGIIVALFIGVVIGAISSMFNRRVLGDFVRALTSEGCRTPESAKTLAELGFLKNTAVRASLRAGGVLGRVVSCVEEDAYNASVVEKRGIYELRAAESGEKTAPFRVVPYKRDISTAHFYIPAEKCDSAEMRFRKKGTNWAVLVIGIIASAVLLWLVLRILPELLQMLDNFVGGAGA